MRGTTATTSAAGKSKSTAPLRGEWTAQAVAPEMRGHRAAAWIAIWDKGSVARRVSLLESLKALHADSNSNALEDDLGDAAPLFFARLTSWWKLRYGTWATDACNAARAVATATTKRNTTEQNGSAVDAPIIETKGLAAADAAAVTSEAVASPLPPPLPPTSSSSELLAQVEAITVFVRGSRYLLQLVEGGGAEALCDCLDVTSSIPLPPTPPPSSSADEGDQRGNYARERRAITLLLLHIANSGRVYREMVGEADNLLRVLHALLRETDAAVANLITELLAVLGKGHPRLSAAVQTGLVRVLASALPPSEENEDATRAAGLPAPLLQPDPAVFSPPSADGTSTVVVLSTARAIRALQLQAEQQHYSQFPSAATNAAESMRTTTTASSAGKIDYVPIIGLDTTVTAKSFAAVGSTTVLEATLGHPQDPLLRPFTLVGYLDTLFRLALDEQHTAYRVEGNELLNLAAKNIQLTPKILTRCLDVVDDDVYVLDGGGEGEAEGERGGAEVGIAQSRLRRQRRQLSCGRAAVLIFISQPMTSERRDLLLHLVAQRGGHLTLLKYLRLTQHGDTAAVVDCCHALQFIARASMELQRRRLGQQQQPQQSPQLKQSVSGTFNSTGRSKTSETVLLRVTEGIQSALGEAVLLLLLFQELSEEDCMTVLRSARAADVVRAE
ncbi:hypothetical protein ABB37_05295 [Leptomonas pyrrhocoris]|uniref:Uncharacterized protein n=1 Tax=Leptomonas pyrrhocoris TaxID=157538 RepID=A0A0M9FZR2_LEPPY|nr:hypothetical protein ABB37_05295 [Leptomonas pyrrhocoris]KPA79460.1 hypothetical protein ABB37_05295 [Leptomonas pyrrhocoris]|eukprot:XP_015657899.1 hypothetical protein ABB37_05295 [Leptomonas pyrrhocoris]